MGATQFSKKIPHRGDIGKKWASAFYYKGFIFDVKKLFHKLLPAKRNRVQPAFRKKLISYPRKFPPYKIMVHPLCFNGKNQLNTILTLTFILLIFPFCMSTWHQYITLLEEVYIAWNEYVNFLQKKLHSPRTIYILCNIMYILKLAKK